MIQRLMLQSFILMALLHVQAGHAQTITGTIRNASGEIIPVANVIIRDSANAPNIKAFTIARNGTYSINVDNAAVTIFMEVTASKYVKETVLLKIPAGIKYIVQHFQLTKDTLIKLADVTVTAKTRPFQISGDTVSYNVDRYKDGSERKIQDIIKKLPGIDLNEKTGEIRYKGKTIETVKLDGDDIFGADYTIGTKNINADMIEQVQAIEHYSDNPLLKGIESGDKVALNLTLKKKGTDFSGNVESGAGIFQDKKIASDISANLLGISKKYKSFLTTSYNNIGINNTPFDYFSYAPSNNQLKEAEYAAVKVIPEIFFDIDLDSRRNNINRSFFSSYSSVFKIGKKASLKTNVYYFNDRIRSVQYAATDNFINDQRLLTSDNYDIRKDPVQYRSDVELKFNVAKNALLEYKIKLKKRSRAYGH